MKHNIVDFVTLCETPYDCDFNEPFAVLVLLSKDLMLIDLQGYVSFLFIFLDEILTSVSSIMFFPSLWL